MFLPVVGPVWALIKGLTRLLGKKITYNQPTTKYYHTPDARYKSGQRVVGSGTVNKKVHYLKSESSREDVKRFHIHAIIYIIVALCGVAFQVSAYNWSKEADEAEKNKMAALTKWNNITITDDFSEITTVYDMIYPMVDSTVVKDFIIMRKEGYYYLLTKWSNDVERDYLNDTATVEVKTESGIKQVTLKEINTDYHSGEYLTPENKKVDFNSVLRFPKGVFPYKGTMMIRAKEKVYTYTFDW